MSMVIAVVFSTTFMFLGLLTNALGGEGTSLCLCAIAWAAIGILWELAKE